MLWQVLSLNEHADDNDDDWAYWQSAKLQQFKQSTNFTNTKRNFSETQYSTESRPERIACQKKALKPKK